MTWLSIGRPSDGVISPPVPGEQNGIVAEVLNTTDVDGLARAITYRLRRAGIDVVYFGTERAAPVESTRILVRRGDPAQGERVRAALGFGRVEMAPDARRLLDVSVLLGSDAAGALSRHP